MRVLLIDANPYAPAATPLSVGNLGAVLAVAGHHVRVMALGSDSTFSPRRLRGRLLELAPDLVGFSTYQRNLFHVRALARLVKQLLPGCRTVLGGPQALFLPDEALAAMPEVDYLCRGEGELAIAALVKALEDGRGNGSIPGLTTRTAGGGWIRGEPVEAPQDLDCYPSPWLTGVLDPADHNESILLTSRGCPYRCSFCITPAAFGGSIRYHSVERVLEDIEYVVARGSGRLWFADPNFSCDQGRVVKLLEGILSRGLEASMWLETRADMLDPELVALMKRAGVHTVALGLESASPEVAARTGKELEPQLIERAVTAALAGGLDVELFSQFGLPGESYDDAMRTLAFVNRCRVSIRGNSNAQQMQLYFGSEISASPADHGVRPLRPSFPPHLSIGTEYETEWMSVDEIRRVRAAWRAESLDGGKRIVS